ncbi:MAG: CYTH domain-containing protein [Cellulosilyticaceae bacterium]
MEIERKYLVKDLPDLKKYQSKRITQGYISTDPVIRIRQMGTQYCLCMKSQGHMIREEFELNLTKEQYENLWNKVEFSPIKKTRYFIPLGDGLTAELDLYDENLEGLMTVEVEFDSSLDAGNFKAPVWFGTDITHDNRYKNNHLSMYGIPKLA